MPAQPTPDRAQRLTRGPPQSDLFPFPGTQPCRHHTHVLTKQTGDGFAVAVIRKGMGQARYGSAPPASRVADAIAHATGLRPALDPGASTAPHGQANQGQATACPGCPPAPSTPNLTTPKRRNLLRAGALRPPAESKGGHPPDHDRAVRRRRHVPAEIADLLGYHPAAMRRWLHRFSVDGIPCLPDRPRPDHPLPAARVTWTLRGSRQVLTPATDRRGTIFGALDATPRPWVHLGGRPQPGGRPPPTPPSPGPPSRRAA